MFGGVPGPAVMARAIKACHLGAVDMVGSSEVAIGVGHE